MKPSRVVRTAAPQPAVAVRGSDEPLLSCLIVSYGTGPVIVDCLRALDRTLTDAGVAFEVIVVDNLHPVVPRRSRRLLHQTTAGVRVIESQVNLGFAGGNNLAAQHARGQLLAFLNPDIIVSDGWFGPLHAALDRATIAAPVLLDEHGTVAEAGVRLLSNAHTAPVTERPEANEITTPLYASAACWVVERAEFDRLGGFDDGFHPAYYEDVDFGLRARESANGTAVVGASAVTHLHGRSTADATPPPLDRQHARLTARWRRLLATLPDA